MNPSLLARSISQLIAVVNEIPSRLHSRLNHSMFSFFKRMEVGRRISEIMLTDYILNLGPRQDRARSASLGHEQIISHPRGTHNDEHHTTMYDLRTRYRGAYDGINGHYDDGLPYALCPSPVIHISRRI